MGATDKCDVKIGGGCLDLGPDILGGGLISEGVRVGDLGD